MPAPIFVLWNRHASRADGAADMRRMLEQRRDVRIHDPGSSEDVVDLAARAADAGARLVVAAGGDGTANAVANGLATAQRRVPLAVIPLGTGNDLCRTLGIPLDAHAAIELLDDGVVRDIDLVEVETATRQGFYVNMAAGGYSGQIVETTTDATKKRWGPLSYLRQAAGMVADLAGEHVSYDTCLRFDDAPPERFTLFNLVVANGTSSAGGLQVAPRADPADGLLDCVMVLDGSILDLAALAARLVVGDYLDSEQIVHRRARRVAVDADPPMLFSADGDVVASAPMTFTVHRRALSVMVPPSA